MADYNPIPLQVQSPDMMRPISGMLNMANSALTYKRNQATFDADVAQKQAESSSAQSKATVDSANVNPLIEEQAAKTSTAQTGATQAKFGLQKDYMGTALQTASGLINDPRLQAGPNYKDSDAAKAISEAQRQMVAKGVPEDQAAMATAPLYMKVHEPGAVQQALKNTITGNLGPQGQVGAAAPTYLGTGGQYTNINPLQTPVQATVNGTVPVGDQHTLGNDVNGNPVVLNKSPQGIPQAPSALPSPNGAPAPQPMTAYPPGESQQTKQAREQEVLDADSAFRQGQQVHDINKTVISELDKGIDTGKLGEFNHYLATRTGYNGAGGEDANSYELLQKMLARSAIASAQKMGPNTNAGLEAQGAANGTVAYGPATLKNIAHLNDAIQTGVDNYNHGMHAAIANGGSVFAKTKFDQQWSANANIDALKLSNAIKLGDQKQIDAVIAGLGGKNSSKFNAVVKNIQNLSILTQKGSL